MKKKDRILIIGGCGYLGSRLYGYLKNKNYKVDTFDLEWFGNFVNADNVKKNYSRLSQKDLKKFSIIILLAGHSSIPMSEKSMYATFKNNVVNFVSLLDKITTQKLIYASSASVYGNTYEFKAAEDYDKYSPTNYYDLTKKEIDYYAHISNKKYFGLRMGTVCGFSPNLRIDVMINRIFETAVKDHEIIIFNKNFNRPILGIEDFVRAVEVIIKKNAPPGLYNVASFNTTIEHIANGVAQRLGDIKVRNIGLNAAYYDFSISTEKFKNAFQFEFKETLDSILESLINNQPAGKSVRR